MKRLLYMALAVLLVVVTHTVAQAEAQGRINDRITRVRPGDLLGGNMGIKPPETDLRVDGMGCHGYECCEKTDISGAFFMRQIEVNVSNYPSSNGNHVNIPSVLTVTYYDFRKKKEIKIIKELPAMSTSQDGVEYRLSEIVVNSPVLVGKWKGIRAEIAPKDDNTIDRNTSNNVKTVKACFDMPLGPEF
ncbi:MAG: hypothetical protein SD837_01725 [Candidatus Electrothrix scaldis]|nr:MAG: hypothetical protein SD837_01725 [Candidatus Electrothrix sp. GW3-3]